MESRERGKNGMDRERTRHIRRLMVFGALLILGLIYSRTIFQGAAFALSIIRPFLYGGAIAFVLHLPMKMIEEKLLGKWKGKLAVKLKRPVSLAATLVLMALIISLVVCTVIPQVSRAVSELSNKIPMAIARMAELLERYAKEYPELLAQVEQLEKIELNWGSIMAAVTDFLRNGMSDMISSTVSVAGGIIGGVVNAVIAFIFALYILSQKEKLADQSRRILSAYLPERAERSVLKVTSMLYRNFSNFISGQCLEAVILGTMFVVAMSLFRMPYAVMVGVLVAFTALIPVVGAFIGCAVGAFLILIENPVMAFWFVILFLVLQQIEGNLIYPRVVGNSVGLPAIWVLMAVSLGGSLFGIAGMLLFIPLLSTGYALLREDVNSRNGRKAAVVQAAAQEAAAAVQEASEGVVDEISQ